MTNNAEANQDVRMNTEAKLSWLESPGGPPIVPISWLTEIVQHGTALERAELRLHREYLTNYTDELEMCVRQLRELLAKLAQPIRA
jgi:hypothetical protein